MNIHIIVIASLRWWWMLFKLFTRPRYWEKCRYWRHPLTNQITGKSVPTNRRSIYQYCLHSSESPWAQEGLMVTGWTGPRWFLTRNVKSNPRSFLENKFFLFWGAQNNFLSPKLAFKTLNGGGVLRYVIDFVFILSAIFSRNSDLTSTNVSQSVCPSVTNQYAELADISSMKVIHDNHPWQSSITVIDDSHRCQ